MPASHVPVLETGRLLLRRPELSDLDRWGEMMQDMESARFIGGVSPMPLGWAEVVHCIDPRNARSQALARRLGSTILRQGRMPPPLDQEIIDVWGQSREQWRARRGVTQSSKSSQTG